MFQGYRNSLRSVDRKVLPPPFDLTIARAEKRQFRDSSGRLVMLNVKQFVIVIVLSIESEM